MNPPIAVHPAAKLRTGWLLAAIYVVTTVVHIWLLSEASRFPHISSDEVQYSVLGESIRAGRGYTVRGVFHSSAPPFYPLVVMAAHSVGPDPRASLLVLSSLIMCAAVFPAFLIARRLGVDRTPAVLLSVVAGFVPHTFYAGTYMAETLQYPLFLTAFLFVLRWLETPSIATGVALGCSLAAIVLTKIQGLQLVGAFLLTLVVHLARAGQKRRMLLGHTALVAGVVTVLVGGWLAIKFAHHATLLGTVYGQALGGALEKWSPRLAAAYFADYFLAAGLITFVPMIYWFRETARRNFILAFFVASTLLVQIGAVSTLDGGLTGWLRERLFFHSLPLMGMIAVKGLERLRQELSPAAVVALVAAPSALLAVLMLYPFHVSSVIEVPWANAIGSLASSFERFTKWSLLLTSLLITGAAAMAMVIVPREKAPTWLAAFLIGFHGCGFAASSKGLAEWSRMRRPEITSVLEWLSANGVRPGDRLLISGRHGYFEGGRPCAAEDPGFLHRTWGFGLTEPLEWQIETLGRFDVRMVTGPDELLCQARPGDYFLSAARFSGLDPVAANAPFYLYRMTAAAMARGKPQYDPDLPVAPSASGPQTIFSADVPASLVGIPRLAGFACYVDLINDQPPGGKVTVDSAAGLQITGWAADVENGTAPAEVVVELSSSKGYYAIAQRNERVDVATAFGKPGLVRSGFTVSASVLQAPSGLYSLRVLQIGGGQAHDCDTRKTVEIRSSAAAK